jgi:hypothetical protein
MHDGFWSLIFESDLTFESTVELGTSKSYAKGLAAQKFVQSFFCNQFRRCWPQHLRNSESVAIVIKRYEMWQSAVGWQDGKLSGNAKL